MKKVERTKVNDVDGGQLNVCDIHIVDSEAHLARCPPEICDGQGGQSEKGRL